MGSSLVYDLGNPEHQKNIIRLLHMEEKLANEIWEHFVSSPSMLLVNKKKLEPSRRVVNFLGSEKQYKKKFLEAMKSFGEKQKAESNLTNRYKKEDIQQKIKEKLAKNIVTQYHGREKALEAAKKEREIHKGTVLPDDVPEIILDKGNYWLPDVMIRAKLSKSNGEAIRLIKNGGVYFDNIKVTDYKENVNIVSEHVLKTGKRKFLKIRRLTDD